MRNKKILYNFQKADKSKAYIKEPYQNFQKKIIKKKYTIPVRKDLWKIRGSFTVEAALIVPIVLFCILLILNQGIELYTQTVAASQNQETWEKFEPVKRFRELELLNDLIKDK